MPSAFRPDDEAAGAAELSQYRFVRFLGTGGFAQVSLYVAPDGREVAVKSVSRVAHAAGVNLGAIKELQALRELSRAPCVLRVRAAIAQGDRVHLVLDYCASDLRRAINDATRALPEAAVKGLFAQLLRALRALHAARLVHRDVKPENVLVSARGAVRLADFGHATRAPLGAPGGGDAPPLHARVVTLWYRAPELLARARAHGAAVDMWAAGALLAELLTRRPLFETRARAAPDAEDAAQLAEIARVIGTPLDPRADAAGARAALAAARLSAAEADAMAGAPLGARAPAAAARARARGLESPLPLWPGAAQLPGWLVLEPRAPPRWRALHPALAAAPQAAIDLLSRLVCYDPRLRLTAQEALQHEWFALAPRALEPEEEE
jgi:serine/threonine protein kinase